MFELIENNLVEGTISTSRTFQEAFRMQEGENSYTILAGFIEINQQQIDSFAKFCGTITGQIAMNKRRQEQYHSQKNNKVMNWINRNVYQNPKETINRQAEEKLVGIVSSIATEQLVKQVTKGVYNYSANKANYQALKQVYSFLNSYALTDAKSSNTKRVQLEMAKIRNGLPLSDREKKKIQEDVSAKEAIPLEEISSMTMLNNNPQLCEALAYQLFNLYCQKFGDNEGILAKELENKNFNYVGMDTLLSYYDYLGFTGKHAREILRVSANRYDTISRDQAYYLQLSRMIVRKFSLDIPGVDATKIIERYNHMVQYDPYQLRRKTVQNVGVGAITGLAGLLAKRPDIVLNGGALALSQFQLEDGNLLSIMEREFKKNDIQLEDFNLMLNQSKKIVEKIR